MAAWTSSLLEMGAPAEWHNDLRLAALFGADTELARMLDAVETKCSVCFEAEAEAVLPVCGDQFCSDCIATYWRGRLAEAAWAVRDAVLDCPVCRVPLADGEALGALPRAPSPRLRALAEARLRPQGRMLSRACPACGHDVCVLPAAGLGPCASDGDAVVADEGDESLARLFADAPPCEGMVRVLRRLGACAPHGTVHDVLRHVHCVPRTRAELAEIQLAAVAVCADMVCDACGAAFCFRCAQPGWHGQTCAAAPAAAPLAACSACPLCCVPVLRDDDGGACNETRCLCCGHIFCWQCRNPWGDARCGFYRCVRAPDLRRTACPDGVADGDIHAAADAGVGVDAAARSDGPASSGPTVADDDAGAGAHLEKNTHGSASSGSYSPLSACMGEGGRGPCALRAPEAGVPDVARLFAP